MASQEVAVVDYGAGNLGSICRALDRAGARPVVASRPRELAAAAKAVLPGVGNFAAAMSVLRRGGLAEALAELALVRRRPVLGVCLGLQIMTGGSEEGEGQGLGWIDGKARRLAPAPGAKVPHMGWNEVERRRASVLLAGLEDRPAFYFAHSYAVDCCDPSDVAAAARHGREFAAVVERANLLGIQFHAEKSHEAGRQVVRNFLAL